MALLLGGMYHRTQTCSLTSNINFCLHKNFVIPKVVFYLCACVNICHSTCVLHRLLDFAG